RWYGAATWEGFRTKGLFSLNLQRLAEIAAAEGGADHHFRFIQLPLNLAMQEAFAAGPESSIATAARLGITVVASATLMQARLLRSMPEKVRDLIPGLRTDAQRAIQFTRSMPGVAVALVGMGRRE